MSVLAFGFSSVLNYACDFGSFVLWMTACLADGSVKASNLYYTTN